MCLDWPGKEAVGCREMRKLQKSSKKFLSLGLTSERSKLVGDLTARSRRKRNAGIFFEFTFIKIKSPSREFQVDLLFKQVVLESDGHPGASHDSTCVEALGIVSVILRMTSWGKCVFLWIFKSTSIYRYVRPALIYTDDRFPTFCPLGILEALHYIVLSCGHVFWVTLIVICSCRKELRTQSTLNLIKSSTWKKI